MSSFLRNKLRSKYNLEALAKDLKNTFVMLVMKKIVSFVMERGDLEVKSSRVEAGDDAREYFQWLTPLCTCFQYKSSRGGEGKSHLLLLPTCYQNFLHL